MGKVLSSIKHPFRNFNLESRAHKVISKDKPIAAPKYPSDQLDISRILKEYPKEFSDSLKKNETLDKHLKDVFVTSYDPDVVRSPMNVPNPKRPLPVNRHYVEDPEFGFNEPDKVSLGKVTLKNVLKFITDHQMNAKINNSTKIAQEYLLPEEAVKNILKYHKVFQMYIPIGAKVKAKFAGPRVPTTRIEVVEHKALDAGKTAEAIHSGKSKEKENS